MSFVGIDIGTSFIKGVVLDAHTLRMSHVRRAPRPDPLPGLPPLYRELDPQAVLSAMQRPLVDLLAHAAGCEGIVVCTQMHSLVLVGPCCSAASCPSISLPARRSA